MAFSVTTIVAQYPHYVAYDNENGLPSDEGYSMLQDKKGFIWIGCDAGLFKFDGVRYTAFKCKTQNSKSISNLVLGGTGRIYCVNFQDQIFYIENDSLKELQHKLLKISNIAADHNGLLYVNHAKGVSVFNPRTQVWNNPKGISEFTRSVTVSEKNEVYFLTQTGLAQLRQGGLKLYELNDGVGSITSHYILACQQDKVWLVNRFGAASYTFEDGRIAEYSSQQLLAALENRKITALKFLPDGKLWICTYNGIVCYDSNNDDAQILYPNMAFTDVLIDREGNYWLSTLQNGLLRIPDLSYSVWNSDNPAINNEKLTHLETDGTHIFFSSINGTVGKLHMRNGDLRTFHTGKNADIECLFFDRAGDRLIFHSQNSTYALEGNVIRDAHFQKNAVKAILHAPPFFFFGSSLGLYAEDGKHISKISETWIRQLVYNEKAKLLYAATNMGLQIFQYKHNQWMCMDTLLPNTQVVSIDFDASTQQLFALTFDGKIECNNREVAQLPESVQGNKLRYSRQKIYIASNKGVWVFDLKGKTWNNLNALSGLTSENVKDIVVVNDDLWLATGRGLQRIRYATDKIREKPLARIYLKKNRTTFEINYNESIVLRPEASIYSSNGHFEYAYRINQNEWVKLPATVAYINIQNLPAGAITLELKVIDHLGRDSENTLILKGRVHPPFYKTWWFIAMVAMFLVALSYLFYARQLNKQRKELKRQNELNIAKLTAIRSQMNPHFIFNSLNSIQDLILQKKTVESYDYVVLFAELVRNALNYSNKEFISITEEVEFLNTYLKLEQLRFKSDLHYRIVYSGSDEIDVPPLMIQPFIENALFHGLLHKEGKKELVVRFALDEDALICTIEDNGIGRKQAENIRKRQGQKHMSFALEAIQKRMDIFNEQQGKIVGKFVFEDLHPDKHDTGTRVVVRLPFKRRF